MFQKLVFASLVLACLHGAGAQAESIPVANQNNSLPWLQIASDGKSFVEAGSGRSFVPWGFNYDRDYKMRLLEDYWFTEWPTVVKDFQDMKKLGANVVRIHLQFEQFMESADHLNAKSLAQLKRLVTLAENTGLYLDLTGLACYRKDRVPDWYANLDEQARWTAQANFWQAIAKTCANSPAIFFYDLANEPMVPNGKRKAGDWLAGELGGFTYCQFITLDQAGRKRSDLAHDWVATLASAIHKQDSRHLTTVGLLPFLGDRDTDGSGFWPAKIAGEVDFIAVHIYPRGGKLDEDIANLRQFQIGKPLVIEETFNMSCTGPELRDFIDRSRKYATGWIGFYWGMPPEGLEGKTDAQSKAIQQWLNVFKAGPPHLATP